MDLINIQKYVMKKIIPSLLFCILIFLMSCASPPTGSTAEPASNDESAAKRALVDFFRLLNDGQYLDAAALYTGSYEWLIVNNPDISPADQGALLEYGCRYNGLMCLEVLSAIPDPDASPSEMGFLVEFKLADGSLFVLGPCCGEDETEMPPVSEFQYRVLLGEDGVWRVADLPPYLP